MVQHDEEESFDRGAYRSASVDDMSGVDRNCEPTAASATPETSSRARIQAVLGRGSAGDFDAILKEKIKTRKDKDEHSVAKLRVQIAQLERTLGAEIKRRVDSHHKLRETCEKRIELLEANLEKMLQERSQTMAARLSALELRMDDMQAQVDSMARDLPAVIERKGEMLQRSLDDLHVDFQNEKRDRLNREGRVLGQLQDLDEMVTKMMTKQTSEQLSRLAELTTRMEKNEGSRIGADKEFSQLIQHELGKLRDQMGGEIRERRSEDDVIVEAMNQYMTKAQSTLKLISSVDHA